MSDARRQAERVIEQYGIGRLRALDGPSVVDMILNCEEAELFRFALWFALQADVAKTGDYDRGSGGGPPCGLLSGPAVDVVSIVNMMRTMRTRFVDLGKDGQEFTLGVVRSTVLIGGR